MNAAGLIQMAAARGIDLAHVAGVSSNVDGIARTRARTDIERELGIDVRETVRGRETRGHRRPDWTVAELGQAANGLGVIPWNAALYSFAGSQAGYPLLWQALAIEAQRIDRRDRWVMRVVTESGQHHFYRETLAALVLDHDAHQHMFAAAPALFAVYMGVAPPTWEQHLRDPFRSLQAAYERWLQIARATIHRWIRED